MTLFILQTIDAADVTHVGITSKRLNYNHWRSADGERQIQLIKQIHSLHKRRALTCLGQWTQKTQATVIVGFLVMSY